MRRGGKKEGRMPRNDSFRLLKVTRTIKRIRGLLSRSPRWKHQSVQSNKSRRCSRRLLLLQSIRRFDWHFVSLFSSISHHCFLAIHVHDCHLRPDQTKCQFQRQFVSNSLYNAIFMPFLSLFLVSNLESRFSFSVYNSNSIPKHSNYYLKSKLVLG